MRKTSVMTLSHDLVRQVLAQAIHPDYLAGVSVASQIAPANYAGSAQDSDSVLLSFRPTDPEAVWFRQSFWLAYSGEMNGTFAFKLQESANGVSGWADISGKAIVPETGGTDNSQWIIKLRHDEAAFTGPFARAVLTIGAGTTSICGLTCLGLGASAGSADQNNIASVRQVID